MVLTAQQSDDFANLIIIYIDRLLVDVTQDANRTARRLHLLRTPTSLTWLVHCRAAYGYVHAPATSYTTSDCPDLSDQSLPLLAFQVSAIASACESFDIDSTSKCAKCAVSQPEIAYDHTALLRQHLVGKSRHYMGRN